MRTRTVRLNLRAVTAFQRPSASRWRLRLCLPPHSSGPRSNAPPANRMRCDCAISTSRTFSVSQPACPITDATSAPPAAPYSTAARESR
jgi:hypothetical protein